MTRRLWLNVILLLLVVLLAAVAYFEPGARLATEKNAAPLISLSAAQVESIELQRHDARTLRLERSRNGWEMVAPIRVAASDYRVDGLLQLLTATSHTHFPAAQRPLSSFGLDEMVSRILFNDQIITFGDNEPLGQRRYVLVDDQVHLIDDRYFYQSQLLMTALVDTTLLPKGNVLTEISLPGLLLQQQDDWQASGELVQSPPSMDDINGLVDEWRHIRALQVSSYQADVAEADIGLVFANGEIMVLEILARDPELILGRRELGLRYHFSADQADRLLNFPSSVSESKVTEAGGD